MKIPLQEKLLSLVAVALTALALTACHDGDGGNNLRDDGGDGCLSRSGKSEVLDIMQDWYLWNDEADQFNKYRNIDLRAFEDANALLDFLRYQPAQFDRGFSYITTPEEEDSFFGEGEFVGFGFGMVQVGDEIRLSQVYPGSPAAAAGLQRGFHLVAINGRSIAQIEAAEGLAAALGPTQVGYSLTFTVADAAGQTLAPVNLSKAVVTIDPVPFVTTLQDGDGNNVGYILFNTFITSAINELRAAFAQFGADNVSRVVIDLRYNGGGLVSVSEVLASLLRGPGHESDIYSVMTFNNAHAAENETSFFKTEPNARNLAGIVFITSEGSASASELVINGLTPYFDGPGEGELALVGSRTYGKPVGQFGFDFCNDEFRLRAVTFKSGDYFNGMPVDCPAADDVSHQLGDPAEASLAEALGYLETGSCPSASTPGFGISGFRGGTAKARPIMGAGVAQQHAGAF